MINRFGGDPRLILGLNGSTIKYIDGQPIMDQGFENQVQISLFTTSWVGNIFMKNPDKKIGSDFEATAKGAITLSKIEDIRKSAEKALKYDAFGNVKSTVINPKSNQLFITNIISPPNMDEQKIILEKNGANWVAQIDSPAYRRI